MRKVTVPKFQAQGEWRGVMNVFEKEKAEDQVWDLK